MKLTIGFFCVSLILASSACTKKKSKAEPVPTPTTPSGTLNAEQIPPGTSAEVIANSTIKVDDPVTNQPVDVVLVNPFENASNNVHFTRAMNGKLPDPFMVKPGNLSLSFDKDTILIKTTSSRGKPLLDVFFILDVTSSMGVQLEVARKSFRKFQATMIAAGFDARYSLLTFEDRVITSTSFTDVDSFEARLAEIKLADGGDVAEGALLALQQSILDGANSPKLESIPVVLLVTDATGHNGDGSKDNRDCTLDKTLDSFASDYGKKVRFFYSTPDFQAKGQGDCYTESTSAQFKKLLAKVQEQTPNLSRGQALAWPFAEETLSKYLSKWVVDRVTETAINCPAKKFVMSSGGSEIASGDETKWALNAQGNPSIGPIVAGAELDALLGKNLTMEITRCCDVNPISGGTCLSPSVQTLEFQLAK